jgi:type I restriction enzyme S subunit
MLQLTFKQTNPELMVRAASTVLFAALSRQRVTEVSIADLAERPQYGFTASAVSEPVGPKLVRITDLQDSKIDWNSVPFCECHEPDKYTLRENDILFARTGATTGKTHLVSGPETAVFASYLIRLRPKRDVEAGYLHAFFQSDNYWSQISDEKEGSAQPNVNAEKLAALKIPSISRELQRAIAGFLYSVRRRQDGDSIELPELLPPLMEQRHVVARIEELAAQFHEARTLRRQSAEEAEALVGALSNRLFSSHKNRVPIQSVSDVRGGVQKGPHRIPGVNPVRYLTVTHVQRNRISTEDPRYFEVTKDELERWRLLAGDVLIIEGNGSAAQIGRTALFCGEIENCIHQNHVIRIRPAKEHLLPEFLNAFLNSPAGQEAVQAQSRTTSGLRTLSVGRIKNILIPAAALSEQRRIMSELNGLQAEAHALKRLQAETEAELEALLPSILNRAFKGEL